MHGGVFADLEKSQIQLFQKILVGDHTGAVRQVQFLAQNFDVVDHLAGNGVLCLTGTDGVQSDVGKNIPDRGGAVILVAGVAVIVGGEAFLADPVQPVVSLVLLTKIGVHEGNVEGGLIGDGALAPVIGSHFGHLMDLAAVAAHQIFHRGREEVIQFLDQRVLTAVELCQALDVVLNGKAGLPCSSFGIIAAPGNGGEGLKKSQ